MKRKGRKGEKMTSEEGKGGNENMKKKKEKHKCKYK